MPAQKQTKYANGHKTKYINETKQFWRTPKSGIKNNVCVSLEEKMERENKNKNNVMSGVSSQLVQCTDYMQYCSKRIRKNHNNDFV